MLRRIGLIGDVHSDANRLEAALHWFQSSDLDAILCVGDIADGPGDINRCIELLRKNEVWTVKGNHDDWLLRDFGRDLHDAHSLDDLKEPNRIWLDELPLMREFETSFGALLLCHGVGGNFMRNLRADDDAHALRWNFELQELQRENRFAMMINGHTHRRTVRRFGNILNLNAGKLSDSHEEIVGAAWQVDFESRKAQLRLFDNEVLGESSEFLPFV